MILKILEGFDMDHRLVMPPIVHLQTLWANPDVIRPPYQNHQFEADETSSPMLKSMEHRGLTKHTMGFRCFFHQIKANKHSCKFRFVGKKCCLHFSGMPYIEN